MNPANVRQPLAQIIGIANLLEKSVDYSPKELKKIVGYIKPSALDLDNFTKELAAVLQKIDGKEVGIEDNTIS